MHDSSWKIIAASVAGTSHVEKNLPCQDAFVCETVAAQNGEVLLVVASDGAGSAKHGGDGARIVCRKVADFFCSALTNTTENLFGANSNQELLTNKDIINSFWLTGLQNEFIIRAARENRTPADYACTLLAAAIAPEAAIFWQIGDGAIVFSDAEEFRLFTKPQQGEYANSTYFVTDSHAIDFLQIGAIEKRIDEIAVFTDGLQRIALDLKTLTAHQPFLRPMFAPLRRNDFSPALNDRLIDFLKSDKINERTDDDKTLILASRKRQQ